MFDMKVLMTFKNYRETFSSQTRRVVKKSPQHACEFDNGF